VVLYLKQNRISDIDTVPVLLCWDSSLSENIGGWGGWRQQGKHHKFELMTQSLYLTRPHKAITFNQLLHKSKHFQLLFFSKETNRTLDNFQEQPVYVIKPFLFSPHKWPSNSGQNSLRLAAHAGDVSVTLPQYMSSLSLLEGSCPRPWTENGRLQYWYWHSLLTAVGLTPGDSITVHSYTQTIHKATKWNRIHRT
jgi:hypothetical protein